MAETTKPPRRSSPAGRPGVLRRPGAWVPAALAAAALVVNGALVLANVGRMREAGAAVARTHEVLGELAGLLSALQDAETGQRGYLLTGAPEYLEPWRGAEATVWSRFARIADLTRGDPAQQGRLSALRPVVDAKLAELRSTIALGREPDGLARAQAVVRTGAGKRLMDDVRLRIADLEAAEHTRVEERTAAVWAAGQTTVAAHLGAVAVALLLLGAAVALARSREQALQRGQGHLRRFEAVAGHSRDVVLFLRLADGRILEANAAAAAAYGRAPEELRTLAVHDLRAPGTEALTAAQMAEADARGILFETVHRRRDGSTFPVEVSSQGFTLDGERALVSIVRDITARKSAERALRQSEARLRRLAEALPQLVWTAEADGTLASFNERWRAYTGQAPGTEAWEPALHPDDRDRVVALWREAVTSQREFEMEHRLRRADGEYRWFLRRAILLPEEDGRHRWFGTCTDIHDLKSSQEVLRQADRLKEDFLSMASHELRTPLTSLRLQAQLLARALRGAALPDARAPQHLARVNTQVDRLEHLVTLLLDVSRINAGRVELQLAELDLAQVAREVVQRFRDDAERAGTELRLSASPVVGRWDRARVDQIVTNLLSNAIKYGDRRPVDVDVTERDGVAVVVVRDHGIGVPAEVRPRLFGRFERAENAAGYQGLGLGLWIAREMAHAHGGDISVAGTDGGGATFVVELPRAPRE